MTFARFLQQFEAIGRIKGDGYDPAMFSGMTDAELARARSMMLERGLAGDTVDLSGLRHVGDEATIAALRRASAPAGEGGAGWDMIRLETLFALTGEPAVLAPLLDQLDRGTGESRRQAAQILAGLPLPASLAAALAHRLCRLRYRHLALPLSQAWLTTQGLRLDRPGAFQAHLPLIRAIVAAWPWRRAPLLARIACELRAAAGRP